MEAERWERIEELYHSALSLTAEARQKFLHDACSGDETLRGEVESLLRHGERSGSVLESPALIVLARQLAREPKEEQLLQADTTISHYRIREAIGRGGMGVVYKAEDLKLRRLVALKLLPETLSRSPQSLRRFEREAQAASALNHPNICTIYEIDEAKGLHFIAIEFLDGETLKDRIAHGPLPVNVAASIAIEICRALDAAHSAGIVHRDIKPANIFLTRSGVTKVLDFGVAKRVGPELARERESRTAEMITIDGGLTVTGSTVGTVAYMSPEQTRGEAVDSRTDLFSLGAALFEMVTGRRPFAGETVAEIFRAIRNQSPPSVEKLAAQIPLALSRIIRKTLEKDREARYQRAADLRADLEQVAARLESTGRGVPKLMMAALWIVFMAGIAAGVWKWSHHGGGPPPIRSLVVLPLENLTGDAGQEYFADGMTNALITNLTKVGSLRVISRGSAMTYKGSKKRVAEIARDLNVDAVVEGTVERSGNRVRISAELVDATKGANLWAQNYERDLRDILQLQSEVAWEVVKQVQAQLTPEERQRVTSFGHCTPNAYDLFQQGLDYWYKATPEDNEISKQYFDRAADADPNCAEAYFGIGMYYVIEADQANMPPEIAWPAGRKAISRAIELDPNLGPAYIGLALIDFFYDWNWPDAEKEFKKALELNPGFADSHNEYGVFLRSMGRVDEAIAAVKRGRELDPLKVSLVTALGWTYYFARRWDDAMAEFQEALKRDPQYLSAREGMAKCYLQKGMGKEAIAELSLELGAAGADKDAEIMEHAFHSFGAETAIKTLYRARLEEYHHAAKEAYVSPLIFANLYSLLNEKDEAFRWLEKGYQERASKLTDVKIDPDFDNLRGDPRFDNLVKRVGLP